MHTSGHQYILFYFLFQIMVNKTEKQKAFPLRTIKICRFEIIDGVKYVKYVYCIKQAYKFLLREQLGLAAVLWRLRQCVSCMYIICLQLDLKISVKLAKCCRRAVYYIYPC